MAYLKADDDKLLNNSLTNCMEEVHS